MILFKPWFELWIARSVTDAAAVNPNGTKTLLDDGLSTCPIKDKSVLSFLVMIQEVY